jgi:hypothetical protein
VRESGKEMKMGARLYGFIALSLTFCVILAVAVSSTFSATNPDSGQEASQQENLPTIGNNGVSNPANYAVTKEEAISLAMTYIEPYARENNRTIESINATLWYVSDYKGSRGNSSQVYPEWEVSAKFDGLKDYVFGYSVLVWADNGEIRSAGPQGYM